MANLGGWGKISKMLRQYADETQRVWACGSFSCKLIDHHSEILQKIKQIVVSY